MKTKAPSILWIDDDASRLADGGNAFAGSGYRFLGVHPLQLSMDTDGLKSFGRVIKQENIQLIIVDYDLSGKAFGGKHFGARAPFVLGAVNSAASSDANAIIPIYLISGHFAERARQFNYQSLEQFDRILDDADLENDAFAEMMIRDIGEYQRFREHWKNPKKRSSIFTSFVGVPERDRSAYTAAVSWFLRRPTLIGLSSRSQGYQSLAEHSPLGVLSFIRWLRFGLMSIPGPLLDSRRAAVNLGVKPEFFYKHAAKLKGARYTGPFSFDAELWWAASLRDEWHASGIRVGENDVEYSVIPPKVPADVFGLPLGVAANSPDAQLLEVPIAKSQGVVDFSEQLPPPFDRIYRVRPRK